MRFFNYKNGITDNSDVYIIAEIGVNHNGDYELAKKLIDLAKKSGADAVKFQTFKSDNLVLPEAPKAQYQMDTDGTSRSQKEMLDELQLTKSEFENLYQYCNLVKIDFISSPFDNESVKLLEEIGVEVYKVPSGEITNKFLLEEISKSGKPVILSTGMSTVDEIKTAIQILNLPSNKISILHCVSCYPTNFDNINLKRITLLHNEFKDHVIGFSDHTTEYWTPLLAISMGAKIIEKHITLDNNLPGPDHRASLNPAELKLMISRIRDLNNQIKDNNIDQIRDCEIDSKIVARKSIVLLRDMQKGDIIEKKYLSAKRPATGISPTEYEKLIGKTMIKDMRKDDIILFGDFK